MGGAWASHCVRLHVPGGRNTAAQLCRITKDVISAGREERAELTRCAISTKTRITVTRLADSRSRCVNAACGQIL
jgi:hypothetical protein